MRDTWLGRCFGTRRRGLAPVDLLLLGALLVSLVMGATRLLPRTSQTCLYFDSLPATPLIMWDGPDDTYTFSDPTKPPPIGVAVAEISAGFAPFALDDGQLYIGDRVVWVHLDGKRWLTNEKTWERGAWGATGWTFVVQHNGSLHIYHLTIPCD